MVLVGSVLAYGHASQPTVSLLLSPQCTTDGRIALLFSSLRITLSPLLTEATNELVVPKSIPMANLC